MKRDKFLLKEETNRILELSGSNPVSGKHFVVVDVQPEYENGFSYFLSDLVNFINENYESMHQLTFFFNGEDTLGMINKQEYMYWWIENGLNEEIADSAIFYDKGYAFFRSCMDNDADEEEIVNLVKFMLDNNISDSRDITEEFWGEFTKLHGGEHVRELMEHTGECLNIPDLMDELQSYSNVVMCGGGINECLKEVEIAMQALNKPYNLLTQYCY